MFNITAYYATGHCHRFFADSLEQWGELPVISSEQAEANEQNSLDPQGWVKVWELAYTTSVPEQLDPELAAQHIAEQVFYMTSVADWQGQVSFLGNMMSHINARSLSVADVLVIDDNDGNVITLGVDSCGFRTLEAQ